MWHSIDICKKFTVVVPKELEEVFDYLATKMRTEYAVLTNIDKVENGKIYLKPEYYIPHQKVDFTYIKIDPNNIDSRVKDYDTVIHRHPDGMQVFSSTDEESINYNFKCSLLYTQPNGFVHGIYNIVISKGEYFQTLVDLDTEFTTGENFYLDPAELNREIKIKIKDLHSNNDEDTIISKTTNKVTTFVKTLVELAKENSIFKSVLDFYNSKTQQKNKQFVGNDDISEALGTYTNENFVWDTFKDTEFIPENDIEEFTGHHEDIDENENVDVRIKNLKRRIHKLEQMSSVDDYVKLQQTLNELEEKFEELETKFEELEDSISETK